MQKGLLIAWFGELGQIAEKLGGKFSFDQAQYQWARATEKKVYSQSRPGLLRLLEDVELLEAEQEKRHEAELRKQEYWFYSVRASRRSYRAERAKLEEERNAALLELCYMQRALYKVNGAVVIAPTHVAYLRAPIIAKGRRESIVHYADHLGVQQIIAQISRDLRRLQIIIDLNLNGPDYDPSPLMTSFWSVRTDQDLRALLDGKAPQCEAVRLDGTTWQPSMLQRN